MHHEEAQANETRLKANRYPGRGIVIGRSDRGHAVQVYWIMGRSENSRNRVFVEEGDGVRTKAWDPAKLTDPSLVIYWPARRFESFHVISNGDQTDTIVKELEIGSSFEDALMSRTFEPDGPNWTPRISGLVDAADEKGGYRLSILKTAGGDPSVCQRHFFVYEALLEGFGHCIHTYEGDGDPLPSFLGEPYLVGLRGGADAIAQHWWSLLDPDNRVSLMVKEIESAGGKCAVRIVNAHR
jgi:hypothetical protein